MQSAAPKTSRIKAVLCNSFGRFQWSLYLALILRVLVPTVYQTFRVAILGSLSDKNAMVVASQVVWVGIIVKTVEEALLLPLYHCIGKSADDPDFMRNKAKTGFVASTIVFAISGGVLAMLATHLVTWMAQTDGLRGQTVTYVRLELLSIALGNLAKFLVRFLVILKRNSMLYFILFVQTTMSIVLDFLFVYHSTLNLGAIGAAYSDIASSSVLLICVFCICWSELDMSLSDVRRNYDFQWFRLWAKVGFFSAVDLLIRNTVFVFVILREMNQFDEQDSYWLLNTFIWHWLLVPILPLGDVIMRDVGTACDPVKSHESSPVTGNMFIAYSAISSVVVALWAISYPAWKPFVIYVLRANDPEMVLQLALNLVSFFAFYVVANIPGSILNGLARTDLLALGSFAGNVALVVLFVLMIRTILPNTARMLVVVYGVGLAVGAVAKSVLCWWALRKIKKKRNKLQDCNKVQMLPKTTYNNRDLTEAVEHVDTKENSGK